MGEPIDKKFNYVCDYIANNFPSVDYDETGEPQMFCDLTKAMTFINRYNRDKLNINFKYEEYIKDQNIQGTLEGLKLDPEKFWYLLLFIFDYTCCACFETLTHSEPANKQIEKLIKAINENKSAKLTLTIKDKKIVIDEPYVLEHLSSILDAGLDRDDYMYNNVSLCDTSQTTEKSDTFLIGFFAEKFLQFLNQNVKVIIRAKRGSQISYSKLLLISRLVYFTKLSKNDKFKDSDETLKGCIKQYKDYKVSVSSLIYL